MKLPVLDAVKIVGTNVVIGVLIWAVYEDFQARLTYFRELGFTPSTTYYPFFYITRATDGSTVIQGLLTLDWIQVLAAILVVADVFFAVGLWRRRTPAQNPQAENVSKV